MGSFFTPFALNGSNVFHRYYLLMGNLLFFVPLFVFGASIQTMLLATMGAISIIFHSHQCVHSTWTPHMCMADIVGVNLVAIFLLYLCTPLPLWWWMLWVVPVYLLFADCTSDHEYALMHGSWHILAAVFFGVAIYLSQKKVV